MYFVRKPTVTDFTYNKKKIELHLFYLWEILVLTDDLFFAGAKDRIFKTISGSEV